jgi:mannosyltransferase
MTLIVHPHFHLRRSGVTAHVEAVLPGLGRAADARAMGTSLDPATPRIGWGELLRRARREPLIWHAHRNQELLVGLLLGLVGQKVRLVFTRHASGRPGRLTRMLAARSHRVVSLTAQVARALGLPSTIVPHGVDVERFAPPASRAEAWARLGLGGRYGVGVVGRVRKDKGQGDFVEALRPLLAQHPEWRAVLVGLVKRSERPWAEGLRAAAGDALSLVGEQRDILRWYQGLTLLVHPSYREAHSLVLLEALAAGCCVIATRLEHHPEMIDHGRTGFLYEPGDVPALRALLAELLANPQRAEEVGRNAAEEARRRFGVEREVQALMGVYRELLGAEGQRR